MAAPPSPIVPVLSKALALARGYSLGRFVQADPIVQDLYDTQSYNRYSYVMNRPLSLTDPTGYVADDGLYYRSPNTGNDYSGGTLSVDGMLSGSIDQARDTMAGGTVLGRAYYGGRTSVSPSRIAGDFSGNLLTNAATGGAGNSGTSFNSIGEHNATLKNVVGLFRNDEPSGFSELRADYPELGERMESTLEASRGEGWFDMAEEMGFYALIESSSKRMVFVKMPAAVFVWRSMTYGHIPAHTLAIPRGWELAVIYHTHPFGYSYGAGIPFGKAVRGPSPADMQAATANPSAYAVIGTLSEKLYYGPRAMEGK